MPRIEHWSVATRERDHYLSPELQTPCLQGVVYGHPIFKDGGYILTARIIGKRGELIKTRTGNFYELGEVDTEYELRYTNSKERLLNSLKEVE